MQRALVILAILMLVVVALAAGALTAHWPFWARAWQWQVAADGWPERLPGPMQVLRGGDTALPLQLEAAPLPAAAADAGTRILLWASADGQGQVWVAPGYSSDSMVDGRGLAAGLLAPVYGQLAADHPQLLDSAAGNWIKRWEDDPRGLITPRQLLWELSGLPAGDFQPLNPASRRAQLASGPDFERAARHWPQTWPAGSHFEPAPVNSQLLAMFAARHSGIRYAQLVEQQLWSKLAAADAIAAVDHPRGNIAAHCCMRARATDWLRLGLLLADGGRIASRQIIPTGFVDEMAVDSPVHPGQGLGYRVAKFADAGRVLILETTGRQLLVAPESRRAALWVGEGQPPVRLHQLLGAETAATSDSAAAMAATEQ